MECLHKGRDAQQPQCSGSIRWRYYRNCGVNRDILGTGLGARPIANTDVFCFGPPDYSGTIPLDFFTPQGFSEESTQE